MRGPSAVVFRKGENFLLEQFPTELGPVNINYTSRWLKKNEFEVPGHLWIEIRGQGTQLEEVISIFANAGLTGIPIMALSANAAIGDQDVEVAFENTSGISEREYFQSFIPPESEILHTGRLINVESTHALLNALKTHPESERLLRAINQYLLALSSWKLGHSIINIAHLWMAVEALTKVKLQAELRARKLGSTKELADCLGVDLNKLDATIRKDLILKGDGECYKKALDASDGLEHGFKGFKELRELSKEVRHRMASYVRLSIFELANIDDAAKKILLSAPFDNPIGNWAIVKYLRGKLIGTGNQLAAPSNAYPFIKWRSEIKSFSIDQNGKFQIQVNESFTNELAEGISFQAESCEVWSRG